MWTRRREKGFLSFLPFPALLKSLKLTFKTENGVEGLHFICSSKFLY